MKMSAAMWSGFNMNPFLPLPPGVPALLHGLLHHLQSGDSVSRRSGRHPVISHLTSLPRDADSSSFPPALTTCFLLYLLQSTSGIGRTVILCETKALLKYSGTWSGIQGFHATSTDLTQTLSFTKKKKRHTLTIRCDSIWWESSDVPQSAAEHSDRNTALLSQSRTRLFAMPISLLWLSRVLQCAAAAEKGICISEIYQVWTLCRDVTPLIFILKR